MAPEVEVLARHVSPDEALTLVVQRLREADGSALILVGFEESDWHVHPELFSSDPPDAVALGIVDDVINDRMVIVIEYPDGDPYISLLDTIEDVLEYAGTYASIEFRFWSGRRIDRAELLEGSVPYKPF